MRVTGLESLASVASPPAIAADHGLFVAGLVKAVAPEADVQLYRVLNEYAAGDMFTMMEAIKNFICTGQPDRSVMNLSMGLHWYDEGYLFSFGPEEIDDLAYQLDAAVLPERLLERFKAYQIPISMAATVSVTIAGSAWEVDDNGKQYLVKMEGEKMLVLDKARTGQWPLERCGEWTSDLTHIVTLWDLLNAAKELGVVAVAAAGNNANNAADAPAAADIPADWPNTIGVAATNVYGTGLACFSNAGNVWAPGGEGVTSPSNTECKPQFKTCNAAGNCADYGLVSLGTESSTGYWYWAGTSFAAPLVSSLVARCLQEAADAGAAWPAADVPANVWKAIQAGAANHNGVIHVGDTLAKCK